MHAVSAVLLFLSFGQTPPQEPPAQEKTDAQKYAEAIKDLPKTDGDFVIYRRKGEILLELTQDNFGKLFCYQATIDSGHAGSPGQSGEPLNMYGVDVFRFDRKDEAVWLVQPNIRYRWDENDPLALSAKRAFPEAVIATYKIEQKDGDKVLINVSDMFFGQPLNLAAMVGQTYPGGYSLDKENSKAESITAYGNNTVVKMALLFSAAGEAVGPVTGGLFAENPGHLQDKRSAPLSVTYTLWYRKDDGYKPRLSDHRIGYFTEDFFSVGLFAGLDRTERLINRFDLRKKNPGDEMSPPNKQVVWTIDTSVPKEYRAGVKRGVLMWNMAFEKVGIQNAFAVREADPGDKDYDHSDARNNVIRWVMSRNNAYAVALFRTDPISGQVLNAAVNVDANYAALMKRAFDYSVSNIPDKSAVMDAFKSGRRPEELVLPVQRNPVGVQWRSHRCGYAETKAESASRSLVLAEAIGIKLNKEKYIEDFMADLIAHEVGHCIGLRHNFAASTNLSTEQLADESTVDSVGIAASVMDYSPVNIPALLKGGDWLFNRVVGPYDIWAVEYGYKDFGNLPDSVQYDRLQLVARQTGLPGHVFLTDEEADNINPLAVRDDMASDTLRWLEMNYGANDTIRKWSYDSAVKPGEDYYRRTYVFLRTFRWDLLNTVQAVRMIGGIYYRREKRGDVGETLPLRPVPAEKQRLASKLVAEHMLSYDPATVPRSVLNGLAPDPNDLNVGNWNAPVRQTVANGQITTVAMMLSRPRLLAIAENEAKLPSDAYSLREHVHTVVTAVFGELGHMTAISGTRRDLQAATAELMLSLADPREGPSDISAVADYELSDVAAKCAAQMQLSQKGSTDYIHAWAIKDRIERFRNRVRNGG